MLKGKYLYELKRLISFIYVHLHTHPSIFTYYEVLHVRIKQYNEISLQVEHNTYKHKV